MRTLLAVLSLGAVLTTTAFAQSAEAVRAQQQQARIHQGVRSGQLTGAETAKLERHETGIRNESQQMRAAHGGHLTRHDRAKIRHQQRKLSHEIRRVKHNNRVR